MSITIHVIVVLWNKIF